MTCLADAKKITAIVEKSDKDLAEKRAHRHPDLLPQRQARSKSRPGTRSEPILQAAGAR